MDAKRFGELYLALQALCWSLSADKGAGILLLRKSGKIYRMENIITGEEARWHGR
jgi:hypothetical protein